MEPTTPNADIRTHSIELKMSAKGERYWDTKIYYSGNETPSDLADIERAATGVIEVLKSIDASMRIAFGGAQ